MGCARAAPLASTPSERTKQGHTRGCSATEEVADGPILARGLRIRCGPVLSAPKLSHVGARLRSGQSRLCSRRLGSLEAPSLSRKLQLAALGAPGAFRLPAPRHARPKMHATSSPDPGASQPRAPDRVARLGKRKTRPL